MALKPLIVKIGADTTALERGLDRAGRNIKGLAVAAGAAGVAVAGALTLMTKSSLASVDAQAKLARSLGTSVASIQNLERAGELAGVSMSGIEQATKDLTRRLSQAATGAGPAKDALKALGLSAQELLAVPLDERVLKINSAIEKFVPVAQRAAVAGMLFGEEGSIAMSRIDAATIRQATEDVRMFGVAVGDEAAAKIEVANDALSRISLVFTGLGNKLAVEVAPILQTVADQFTALAGSQSVQAAIERLVSAFGALSEIIMSEDFIGAAIGGLEGMANIAATVAEGMVTLSSNVEVVTLAFSGLAIAVAAAGGPITVVVGALALALGGIAAWRAKAEDAAAGSKTAAEAQVQLNAALGTFADTAAPTAATEAIDLANQNYALAQSALAAAQAEIAKMQAAEGSLRSEISNGFKRQLTMEEEARISAKQAAAVRDRMQAEKALAAAQLERDRVARQVMSHDTVYAGTITVPSGDTQPPPATITPFDLSGVGGGAEVQDKLKERLDALQTGLMTEREAVQLWYQEGLDVLKEARDAELLTEQEYMAAKERLEQEHQERLAGIRDAGNNAAFSAIVGSGKQILNAIGQNNKKAAKAAQALGAFEAMVNAYRAAAQVLADPTLPWWQKASAAAATLAAGIGFVNSIKGLSEGSSSSGGGAASSAGGGAVAAAPAMSHNVTVSLPDQDVFSRSAVLGLIKGINDAVEDGAIIRVA